MQFSNKNIQKMYVYEINQHEINQHDSFFGQRAL